MTNVEPSYSRGSIYPPLSILAIGLFTVGTNAFIIAGLLPDIARHLDATPGQVSYAITWYSLVVAVGAPAIAMLLPRLSRTVLMAGGLFVFALGGLLAALAPTLVVFVLGRILAGVGGAALVPAATAAAAAIARPEQRGRAIGFVAVGFSLATALGSPLGTALGSIAGWRTPLLIVVGIGVVTALLILWRVRDIPVPLVAGWSARLAPLREPRLIAALVANVLLTAGFNIVYIFSSAVTSGTTGGDGTLLAGLLLCYGIAGVVGNALSGPLTDRVGNRVVATSALGAEIVVLLLIPLASGSFLFTAVLFVLWGLSAFGSVVPVQHRLVAIDPPTSGIAISWFTTAMYAGIALAPPLGAAVQGALGAQRIPVAAAVVTALAIIAFQFAYARRPRVPATEPA
ncbi:MFS transporter [Galbitalea sp. SE-J8]|uniref:MFS transporter n=1 Tax=Galbitalea sp. SE-J8 TaxID=3054952 RepID=UPI00259D1AD0|nr:MFS transporter [Galbitalea sp. SE-J8]MDM4762244.1 MFS transporter [Galbitalea sp. SE-J8]